MPDNDNDQPRSDDPIRRLETLLGADRQRYQQLQYRGPAPALPAAPLTVPRHAPTPAASRIGRWSWTAAAATAALLLVLNVPVSWLNGAQNWLRFRIAVAHFSMPQLPAATASQKPADFKRPRQPLRPQTLRFRLPNRPQKRV